ncbi:MAG: MarC family NAAT transporter [Opitutaceae bacterium]|nr:MarC family NAAT transporter [Opitutaceae bacterium]
MPQNLALPASHFWELILGTFLALFPIINPFAASPVFLAITDGDSKKRRDQQARMGCVYMVVILVASLVGGTFIMSFFGISIPGIRIAGGFLVAGIGMGMVSPPKAGAHEAHERAAAQAKEDISFTPLAMPMLSGPGSIAVTIGFTSLAKHPLDYAAIILGIFVVALASYVVLRLSVHVVRWIGVNGMSAMTKIMGFLLLCVGIQFMVNGLIGVASDSELLREFRGSLAVPK